MVRSKSFPYFGGAVLLFGIVLYVYAGTLLPPEGEVSTGIDGMLGGLLMIAATTFIALGAASLLIALILAAFPGRNRDTASGGSDTSSDC
jgi:hypothetical protein